MTKGFGQKIACRHSPVCAPALSQLCSMPDPKEGKSAITGSSEVLSQLVIV